MKCLNFLVPTVCALSLFRLNYTIINVSYNIWGSQRHNRSHWHQSLSQHKHGRHLWPFPVARIKLDMFPNVKNTKCLTWELMPIQTNGWSERKQWRSVCTFPRGCQRFKSSAASWNQILQTGANPAETRLLVIMLTVSTQIQSLSVNTIWNICFTMRPTNRINNTNDKCQSTMTWLGSVSGHVSQRKHFKLSSVIRSFTFCIRGLSWMFPDSVM